jgi:selenocysteine lyase/cysteine desulfurase
MNPFHESELADYRKLFPVCENFIYLNHAGVAPISRRVATAVEEFNQEALHEGYTAGPRWAKRFSEIRHASAKLIGAAAEEIAFVKNTSHGLSLIARGLELQGGDEVIISEVEFPTNVYPWMALAQKGIILKKIPERNGELDLETLKGLVSNKTRLLSLSSVQYGTGFRLPLRETGKFCRERGIYFCVDAIQSLGAFPLDVREDCVDFLSADAHKWMLGPEGIGLLYIRRELIEKIEPVLLGWNSVEGALNFDKIDFTLRRTAERFEEGSHNGLSIYGMGGAVDLLLEVGVERISQRILYLTDLLIQGLQDLGLTLTNSLNPRFRSGIVTFRIPKDEAGKKLSQMERHLFSKKIYASIRRGSLRLSPHFYNSEEEIQKTLQEIKNYLAVC